MRDAGVRDGTEPYIACGFEQDMRYRRHLTGIGKFRQRGT